MTHVYYILLVNYTQLRTENSLKNVTPIERPSFEFQCVLCVWLATPLRVMSSVYVYGDDVVDSVGQNVWNKRQRSARRRQCDSVQWCHQFWSICSGRFRLHGALVVTRAQTFVPQPKLLKPQIIAKFLSGPRDPLMDRRPPPLALPPQLVYLRLKLFKHLLNMPFLPSTFWGPQNIEAQAAPLIRHYRYVF